MMRAGGNLLRLREELQRIAGPEAVLVNEPMKEHTTFRIGGPADLFVMPSSVEAVTGAVLLLKEREIPFFILGNGSNLLVSDEGYRGVVIQIARRLSSVSVRDGRIHAEAGVLLKKAASEAARHSLQGMEFASGIPGTLGGACLMNAGAYGGEMKQILAEVTCLAPDGRIRTVLAPDMGLSYRHSAFMDAGDVILSAVLSLTRGDPEEIRARMDELKLKRTAKQPLDLPSAGSTFKRPEGYFAGKLIMDAGLKGYRVGGAQVSEKHCGFVVNRGGATAVDVWRLIEDVRERVLASFGVELVPEVRFLGDF